MAVNLNKCDEVALAELARLHDIQLLLQEQFKFFAGTKFYEDNVLPKLVLPALNNEDYLELPV